VATGPGGQRPLVDSGQAGQPLSPPPYDAFKRSFSSTPTPVTTNRAAAARGSRGARATSGTAPAPAPHRAAPCVWPRESLFIPSRFLQLLFGIPFLAWRAASSGQQQPWRLAPDDRPLRRPLFCSSSPSRFCCGELFRREPGTPSPPAGRCPARRA
jgi:hypothetical protein